MNLNEFAKEVHLNAVEHGWWDEERSFGEIVALCHSELSEALEEFRAKRPMVWYKCDGHVCDLLECEDCETRNERSDKPEGIAVELADCIIRILDWYGKENLDVEEDIGCVRDSIFQKIEQRSFGDTIAELHHDLSNAYAEGDNTEVGYRSYFMAMCIVEIMDWAEEGGVDMENILHIKHEYNKTRPYRHGGKAL